MKYEDFVDLSYKPRRTDLICKFYVEPTNRRSCGAVAAESSIGTWTELTTLKPYMLKLAAKVFEVRNNEMKVAYPIELFEPGNMPNILSSVAGNVFGMKEVKNLRFLDVVFPEKLIKSFKGPKYGIQGIRKIVKVKKRPLCGTIIKPKLGLKTEDHAKVAYQAWVGGVDVVKDDENLSSQSFNKFENRLKKTFSMKRKAERETGEKKIYMINITAETKEMLRRAKLAEDIGNEYVMVDIITTGWSSLQALRNEDFDLVLHAHRAGHATFTRNPKHGISMRVISLISRIIGLDQLHVGTVIGKMFESKADVLDNCNALKMKLSNLRQVMPVASGGLNPCDIPELMRIFGNDFVMQMGGGIHGHPSGTKAGSKAVRQAIDAVTKGISLKDYSRKHIELRLAIDKWG